MAYRCHGRPRFGGLGGKSAGGESREACGETIVEMKGIHEKRRTRANVSGNRSRGVLGNMLSYRCASGVSRYISRLFGKVGRESIRIHCFQTWSCVLYYMASTGELYFEKVQSAKPVKKYRNFESTIPPTRSHNPLCAARFCFMILVSACSSTAVQAPEIYELKKRGKRRPASIGIASVTKFLCRPRKHSAPNPYVDILL